MSRRRIDQARRVELLRLVNHDPAPAVVREPTNRWQRRRLQHALRAARKPGQK